MRPDFYIVMHVSFSNLLQKVTKVLFLKLAHRQEHYLILETPPKLFNKLFLELIKPKELRGQVKP